MIKYLKRKSPVSVFVTSLVLFVTLVTFIVIKTWNSASTIYAEQSGKIKILIVPGHEPGAGGAEYQGVKERDLNVQLAQIVKNGLPQDTNLEVIMTRDVNGWNIDLENYVTANETKIMKWVASMKNKMLAKVGEGKIGLIDPDLKHNDATDRAVLFLYGTNKWIADNNIDLVLHVHFNNNPKINGKPNYKGYAIYVPEKQYGNASSSRIFANYLYDEIDKIQWKSNMPQEKDTIIESQELIATGNYNTLKIPSVVVEYAYIYEPMIVAKARRDAFIAKAASSTVAAIQKYIADKF